MVGAGRHQRRAILRAQELGLRVVGVDRNREAPGLAVADVGEVVDFTDVGEVTEVGRKYSVDGVLTVSADRAVPVVAAVAETLGLPGIGTATAHAMTNKIAMRRLLAERGVTQPAFAALRTIGERRAALAETGLPAVLKPADSGGQRGVFRIESLDDLESHLHAALAESATGEAIVESFHEGLELNGLAVARNGEVKLLTLSDRLRPPGIGFGVGWTHVYPSTLFGDTLARAEDTTVRAIHALGLRNGIAFPQVIVSDDGECLVVEVALRLALGLDLPDDVAKPRFTQPLAIKFLTASPGPLPTGRIVSVGSLDKVLAFPGVVQAELYLQPGETIRPVRLDGDRRGYVIAVADTNVEALERAEAAARLVDVIVE